MTTITSGQIWKGFLKSGGIVNIVVNGAGTVKTIALTGEQSVVQFGALTQGRDFGAYHGDTDFEIYVENGTCAFDSNDMVVESLRKINTETNSADIFELDELGAVVGLINPATGGSVSLGGGGAFSAEATQDNPTSVRITSAATADPEFGGGYTLAGQTDNETFSVGSWEVVSELPDASSFTQYEARADLESASTDRASETNFGVSSTALAETTYSNGTTAATSLVKSSSYDDASSSVSELVEVTATQASNTTSSQSSKGVEHSSLEYKTLAMENFAECRIENAVNVGVKDAGFRITVSTDATEAIGLLEFNGVDDMQVVMPSEVGTDVAEFTTASAPVPGMVIVNWLKIRLNGQIVYIPCLS